MPEQPPGWYPDGNGTPRWWDGTRWDMKRKAPRDAMVAGITPAGWYPNGVNGQTYWDGRGWTAQHAPLAAQKNPAAVASLVLAIVAVGVAFIAGVPGIILAGVLLILAIVLGLNGLARAGKPGGTGRGIATAGIVIAILPIAIIVVSRSLGS